MLTRLGERGGTGGGGPLEPAPEPNLKLLGTRSLRTAGKLTGVLELPPTPTLFPAALVPPDPTTVLLNVTAGADPDNELAPVGCGKAEPVSDAGQFRKQTTITAIFSLKFFFSFFFLNRKKTITLKAPILFTKAGEKALGTK